MDITNNTGLVLEGGGMRGVFTCGVLDYFLDRKIYFPYGVGVSAGACHGLSYMSRQRGRAKKTVIDLLKKHNYIGVKHLWTQRSILDQDFLYNKVPHEILPFDYDACLRNPATFEMVTTNCVTGISNYLTERHNAERLVTIAKASSSLPFVCPIVYIDGVPMLDGGIVDSIPVQRSIDMGHPFNIVVSTRNKGWRDPDKDKKVPHFIYKSYPRLRLQLSKRHSLYNEQLDLVDELERKGDVLVFRPIRPLEVSRMCDDVEKLTALYQEGYDCAAKVLKGVAFPF